MWSVVGISEVVPRPFHPDRAGGLSEVGKIGLRNQYLLAAIGVQIVGAALVAQAMAHAAPGSKHFQVTGIIVGAIVYALLGPFVFVSPLLPFRKSMQDKKLRALQRLGDGLQRVVDSIITQLPNASPTADQEKEIGRYKSLMKLVEREPVWPFDTVTLRRFFTAYLVPVFVWALALSPIKEPIERAVAHALELPVAPTHQGSSTNTVPARNPAPTNAPSAASSPPRN